MKLLNISTSVQLLSSQTPRKPAVRSLPRLDDETGWKGGLDRRQGVIEGGRGISIASVSETTL